MKTLLILLTFITLTYSENTKHVFWYKCIQNNYRISDSANGFGPNIQGDVIKHEGKAFTVTTKLGIQEPLFTLGNGLDNAQARSSVFWYKDLCELKFSPGSTLKSAKFRGEYRDNWMGNAFCNTGPLRPRVGVVNIKGHLDALWATPSTHPDNAVWSDPLNPLSGSMGYDKSGDNFKAQEIKNILAPYGTDPKGSKPLEGKFFEMDITKQVQFILNNDGQLGIAAVVNMGDGSTGKINLYAFEDCPKYSIPAATSDPWTQDGNTTHLLLEIENGTLIPKDQNASEKVSIVSNKLSLAVQPNPFNAST
ncbi:MAG: hypothetical protein JNL74_02640, partial [Fibrobacteres bacterium]|nr:hypothetical protein [Fibrobacterota bacterium]